VKALQNVEELRPIWSRRIAVASLVDGGQIVTLVFIWDKLLASIMRWS